jgi:UDP-N-acetylglucosamine 2-epimerase (non-hydrolysing)
MKLTLIAGARPNFMKIAPIINAIKKVQNVGKDINYRLVHTGQHYDKVMSQSFYDELNIPKPDVNLGTDSETNYRTANKDLWK